MEVYLPCCVCQGSDQRIRLADLGGTQALLWTSTTFLAHNHMRKSRHINGDAKLYSQGWRMQMCMAPLQMHAYGGHATTYQHTC